MELICPACKRTIESAHINVITDLSKCEHCGSLHKVSSLFASADYTNLSTPPKGSKIERINEADDTIRIVMPKKGFTGSDIPKLFFCLFLLGFISYWTWGAAKASVFFALFSIPFWIVSIAMLISIISHINETQILKLNKATLTLVKSDLFHSKNYEYNLQDIQLIKMTAMKLGSFSPFLNPKYIWLYQRASLNGLIMPAIITGSGTRYFFENANDAEQEWITALLTYKVKQTKQQ